MNLSNPLLKPSKPVAIVTSFGSDLLKLTVQCVVLNFLPIDGEPQVRVRWQSRKNNPLFYTVHML